VNEITQMIVALSETKVKQQARDVCGYHTGKYNGVYKSSRDNNDNSDDIG
jgi:hypothetical protein